MDIEQVPQDKENFYEGHKRTMYAKAKDGHYVQALSGGWEVETYFTALALEDLGDHYKEILKKVEEGRLSPLAAHMDRRQMTPKLLALHAGFFTFQVKRHLKPNVFKKLSDQKLKKYADCLNISLEELKQVPK